MMASLLLIHLLVRPLTPLERELTDNLILMTEDRDNHRDEAELWKAEAELCHELALPPPAIDRGLPEWVWLVGLVAVAGGAAALGASL